MNTKKQAIRLLITLSFIISMPVMSVLALDKPQKTEIKQSTELKQAEAKSIRCKKCFNHCRIKPNKTGKCGEYKNIDGKLVPVEKEDVK